MDDVFLSVSYILQKYEKPSGVPSLVCVYLGAAGKKR